MELPNPLCLHGTNEAMINQIARYVRQHQGTWKNTTKKVRDEQGVYHEIYFPDGAEIIEVREVREGYTQIDVGFSGGVLTWYRLRAIDSEEVHNRIGFSPNSFKACPG